MLNLRCSENAEGEIYSDFWMKSGKALEKRQPLSWVIGEEQELGWWMGVRNGGRAIQAEGTACAKVQNIGGMVPWNFMELVVILACLEQRMIEIVLLINFLKIMDIAPP